MGTRRSEAWLGALLAALLVFACEGLDKRHYRQSEAEHEASADADAPTDAEVEPESEPEPEGPWCGDGLVNRADETCDGDDLNGANCADHGFLAGAPGCTDDCELDLSICRSERVLQWGTREDDFATDLAVDSEGYVYVTGVTYGDMDGSGSRGDADAFLVKLSPAGEALWTRQWGSEAQERTTAVFVDPPAGVGVTGWTEGALEGQQHRGRSDAFVAGFTADGMLIGIDQFGTELEDRASGAALVDDEQSVIWGCYVGSTTGGIDLQENQGGWDIFLHCTTSFMGSGWTVQFGTPGADKGLAIAANGDEILTTGYTSGPLFVELHQGFEDIFKAGHDTEGGRLSSNQWGSAEADFAVAVDAAGLVETVCGWTLGDLETDAHQGMKDAYLGSSVASIVSHVQFGTPQDDECLDVKVDAINQWIWTVGYSAGDLDGQVNQGRDDAFLSGFSLQDGHQQTRTWGTTERDQAQAVAVAPDGTVLVAGWTFGAIGERQVGGEDIFLVMLRP